jgi:hypothetical protein
VGHDGHSYQRDKELPMLRAGIVLAVVGVLIAAAASLLFAGVVTIPEVSSQTAQAITWVSGAVAAVFVISGAGAILATRKASGGRQPPFSPN